MSTKALTALRAIGLLDANNNPCDLSTITEDRLRSLLTYYYNDRSRTLISELEALRRPDSFSGLVSSISAVNAAFSLLPSFLVYGHLIVDDPLYRISVPEQEISRVQKQTMGINKQQGIDRPEILNKLQYFSFLAPLIEAELLTVLPLHYLHLPPKELPLFASEDRFRSEVPQHIHDFVHSKAIIEPVILDRDTGSLVIPHNSCATGSRAISISFSDDQMFAANIYFYQEMRGLGVEPESGHIRVSMKWDPDINLPKNVFDAWVYQSINRTIIQRLQSVASEFRLAQSLGHLYITESAFESSLLSQSGAKSPPAHLAVEFLQANKTIIPIQSPQQVLAIREKNPLLFERFRSQLLSVSEQLHGLEGAEFSEKAKRLFQTEIQPHIDEITNAAKSIITSTVKGGLWALGGVALAIISGSSVPLIPALLYGAAGSLTGTYSGVSEYMEKRKQPEFVWSQLKKK